MMKRSGFSLLPAIVVGGVLGASAVALSVAIPMMGVYLTKKPIYAEGNLQLHTLPRQVPATSPRWVQIGQDSQLSAEGIEELGTANSVSRQYVRVDELTGEAVEPRKVVDVHLAYYTGIIDTVPHVPERCLVAGGMTQLSASRLVDVPLELSKLIKDEDASDPELGEVWTARSSIEFQRYRLPYDVENLQLYATPFTGPGGRTVYAGYFFVANGTAVPQADRVRTQAFRLQADYAYYCKVQFTSVTVESVEELGELAGEFLDDFFPDIMRRLPDWVEVQRGTADFTDYSRQ